MDDVSMCKSLLRIQDTWNQNGGFISIVGISNENSVGSVDFAPPWKPRYSWADSLLLAGKSSPRNERKDLLHAWIRFNRPRFQRNHGNLSAAKINGVGRNSFNCVILRAEWSIPSNVRDVSNKFSIKSSICRRRSTTNDVCCHGATRGDKLRRQNGQRKMQRKFQRIFTY